MDMIKKLILLALASGMMGATAAALAKPAFTGQNYSGDYACKGMNSEVGDYEVTITLKLNRLSSYGKFGAYTLEAETVNSVSYYGQAVADGNRLAISYDLSGRGSVERSVGTALVRRNARGRWSFRNLYYEADDTGGNYGSEYCVMKSTAKSGKTVMPQ